MDCAGPIGPDGGKEVLRFQSMSDVIEFLAVARKEDCPTSRSVSDPNNITLYVLRTVGGGSERLVEAPMTG
jgi:hypothetical protein